MNVSMTFTGGQELARNLSALPSALSFKVQQNALQKAAEPMRAEAEALAPRGPDAPHIAQHIIIGIPKGELADVHEGQPVVAFGPAKEFFYGFFWEFGWIRHPAHPFMRPAFDEKRAEALAILARELWLSISIATGKMFRQQANITGSHRARGSGVGL